MIEVVEFHLFLPHGGRRPYEPIVTVAIRDVDRSGRVASSFDPKGPKVVDFEADRIS